MFKFYQTLTAVIEKESSTPEALFYSANSFSSFGQKLPDALVTKLAKNLQASLKKDESLLK